MSIRRECVIPLIEQASEQHGFQDATAFLTQEIGTPTRKELIAALLECGVIPESFGHDSTEEKLYAKYSDTLLAFAFTECGIPSTVITTRADCADVEGKTEAYSIVGDAKAFRLSRTAKNQKDFKVTALSKWKKDADYACLVCPLYQYPSSRSQIYTQAIEYNVTMLGYVHLAFIVECSAEQHPDLSNLWTATKRMPHNNQANSYWTSIDREVCMAVDKSLADLAGLKEREKAVLQEAKKAEIEHIAKVAKALGELSKEELKKKLIDQMKLPAKILQIRNVGY